MLSPLVACADDGGNDGRLQIVAAFYPVAELAQRIGGDRVAVENLTPAGVEPHDVELTSDDADAIEDADLAIYVGRDFQPAIAEAAARRDGPSTDIARAVIPGNDDPHFWLDPSLMVKAALVVRDALTDVDPDSRDFYEANAAALTRDIEGVGARFEATLGDCARRDIVTAHDAFGHLARRYDLVQHGITGVSPEAEPSPARIAALTELVRERGVTTVFYEELVPRDFAETLAKEAGVKTAVLNPLEGLSKDEIDAGDDYVSVMGRNRVALAEALGCRDAS